MKDVHGNVISVNTVVEIRGSHRGSRDGMWLVTDDYGDYLWMSRLNRDMTRSRRRDCTERWPLRGCSNSMVKNMEIDGHNMKHAAIEIVGPYSEPEPRAVSDGIRILKHGIRKGGEYCRCLYWLGDDGSVTVYARDYSPGLPVELGNVRNGTDRMSDYFETDRCVIRPGDPYYDEIITKVTG